MTLADVDDPKHAEILNTGIGWVHELEHICQRAEALGIIRRCDREWSRQLALDQVRLPESKNWINVWFDQPEKPYDHT